MLLFLFHFNFEERDVARKTGEWLVMEEADLRIVRIRREKEINRGKLELPANVAIAIAMNAY